MDEALVMRAKSRRWGALAEAHQKKKREVHSTELGPAQPLASAYIADGSCGLNGAAGGEGGGGGGGKK
jgi:uncharacterized membrane protein